MALFWIITPQNTMKCKIAHILRNTFSKKPRSRRKMNVLGCKKLIWVCEYVRESKCMWFCVYLCKCAFSIPILTFTSYTSRWMKVLSAWSWDVITLTSAIERSIGIMAMWVWSTELSWHAFINIWNMQMKRLTPIKDKHNMIRVTPS